MGEGKEGSGPDRRDGETVELAHEVAGLTCGQVLAGLSDYLDGDLSAEARLAVEAHLAGCDRCARFGGRVGEIVARLRLELVRPTPIAPEIRTRLSRALRESARG